MRLVAIAMLVLLLPGLPIEAGEKPSAPYGFRGLENYKLDRGIFGLKVVDVDGDGRRDLLVVNNAKARIDVLLRREKPVAPEAKIGDVDANEVTGDRFFERKKLLTEKTVVALDTGDLDGDGHVDAVYVAKPDELIVAFGDGKGGFDRKREFRVDGVLQSEGALHVGDLNGDGRSDVVVQLKSTNAIFFQGEDGKLASPVRVPFSAQKSSGVVVVDLDGNGRSDLVQIDFQDARPFRVRFQRGDGKLGPEVAFQIPSMRTVDIVDIDPSEGSEVVVVQRSSGLLRCLGLVGRTAGEGTGVPLGEIQVHPFAGKAGSTKRAMAIGDIDRDGRNDIVVTEPGSAQVALYLQTGEGRLATPRLFPSLSEADDVRIANVADDERNEIVVMSKKEKAVGVGVVDAEGRLPFPKLLEIPGVPQAMDVGDLTGDTMPELAVLTKHENAWQVVVFGRGEDGLLTELRTQKLEGIERRDKPESVLVMDLDRDGRSDLLVFDGYKPIRVYRQAEDGSFEDVSGGPKYRAGLVDKRKRGDVAAVDLDGSGKPTLLVASKGFARSLVLTKDGALEVLEQVNGASPTSVIKGAVAIDVDGDGRSEVAFLDGSDRTVTILRRGEGDVFGVAERLPVGEFSFERLIAKDMNGDGRDDLVVLGTRRFGVLYAAGRDRELREMKSFESPIRRAQLWSFDVGDLNGDGKPDLAIADVTNNSIEIVSYDAEKGFAHVLKWRIFEEKRHQGGLIGSRGEPREVHVDDVDGDGLDDIVLVIHDRILVYPQG